MVYTDLITKIIIKKRKKKKKKSWFNNSTLHLFAVLTPRGAVSRTGTAGRERWSIAGAPGAVNCRDGIAVGRVVPLTGCRLNWFDATRSNGLLVLSPPAQSVPAPTFLSAETRCTRARARDFWALREREALVVRSCGGGSGKLFTPKTSRAPLDRYACCRVCRALRLAAPNIDLPRAKRTGHWLANGVRSRSPRARLPVEAVHSPPLRTALPTRDDVRRREPGGTDFRVQLAAKILTSLLRQLSELFFSSSFRSRSSARPVSNTVK